MNAALDRQECQWLTDQLRSINAMSVLEFGPGESTQAILNAGVTHIDTLEQNSDYVPQVQERFRGHPVFVRWYQGTSCPVRSQLARAQYDAAFIDGPSIGTTVFPLRLAAALFCVPRTRHIILHDSKREIETVAVLMDLGFHEKEHLNSARGMIWLHRISQVDEVK